MRHKWYFMGCFLCVSVLFAQKELAMDSLDKKYREDQYLWLVPKLQLSFSRAIFWGKQAKKSRQAISFLARVLPNQRSYEEEEENKSFQYKEWNVLWEICRQNFWFNKRRSQGVKNRRYLEQKIYPFEVLHSCRRSYLKKNAWYPR